MFNAVLAFALTNLMAGRWKDVLGIPDYDGDRWVVALLRCVLPGLIAGNFALGHSDVQTAALIWLAVTAGSALWFPWGWSFDESTGDHDVNKYPSWIQWVGTRVFPADGLPETNKRRGILMKGIRGGFDILTFALLSFFTPWAMVLWLGTLTMGLHFWACAKLLPGHMSVAIAEFSYGITRGLLICSAVYLATVG